MDRSLRVRTFILVGILVFCAAYLLPTFAKDDSLPSWWFKQKIKLKENSNYHLTEFHFFDDSDEEIKL